MAAAASGKALDEERSAVEASAEWASRKKKTISSLEKTVCSARCLLVAAVVGTVVG